MVTKNRPNCYFRFSLPLTIDLTQNDTIPQYKLGTRVTDESGKPWIYVKKIKNPNN